MRNLIQFLWKYHFVLLFLFVEVIAFSILIQNNSFQRASFWGSMNEVSGNAFELKNGVTEFIDLKKINKHLAVQNAELLGNQIESYYPLTPERILVNDSTFQKQYSYLTAKVINNTVNKRNNYITINQGKHADVVANKGVICDRGVVGIVKATSENFASVMSVLHKNAQISAKLKANNYFGIITWNGKSPNRAQLSDIPAHVAIQPGDTVVTRGSGTLFPPNILIGTINSFTQEEGTDFYEVEVDLSVDFRNLSHVYIVENQFKMEQDSLEQSTQNME